MTIYQSFEPYWTYIAGFLTFFIALCASAHVVLYKRDVRSAIAWVGFIWLVPVMGTILYLILGINRIRRKATALRQRGARFCPPLKKAQEAENKIDLFLPPHQEYLKTLIHFINEISSRKLLAGNQIKPLFNGEQAYAEMLAAIKEAKYSITLTSYIFNYDSIGIEFLETLEKAKNRGVQVRVIIDAAGVRYSFHSMVRALQKKNIPVAKFLPTLLPWRMPYMNMQNHRKILVIDGHIGFTGGINIHEPNLLKKKQRRHVQDLHFRLEGPVVYHLQETFAEDWAFCAKEILEGEKFFPKLGRKGNVFSRGINGGPDEDFEHLRWTINGALSCAKKSVFIVTPYFVPDQPLISALSLCAMKGIEVNILLPEKNNLFWVQWASTALLWQILERGCNVWLTPPPFDHSKLMIVDDLWVYLGSANWDMQSLRLNFEFNVECYNENLASQLQEHIQKKDPGLQKIDPSGCKQPLPAH